VLTIPPHLRAEMLIHLRAGAPNEACGILAGHGDQVTRVYTAPNADNSPKTYSIAPPDMLRILNDVDERGLEVLASFHSHPATPAYPSPTDVYRAGWPDLRYVIVSLAAEPPVMRVFRIVDETISEEELGE
jgi:proteasome lid subunit RPN8/RPN11